MGIFALKNKNAYVATLLQRMVSIDKALQSNRLTLDELKTIALLSTADLANEHSPNLALARKFLDILAPLDDPFIPIQENKALEAALEKFDSEQEDYLPLLSIATDNRPTLLLSVSDFAAFYDVFIKHITYIEVPGELGNITHFHLDEHALHASLMHWISTRPLQLKFSEDPNRRMFEPSGLVEKFLNGSLKRDEWLSDRDLDRGLQLFGLTSPEIGAHVVTLDWKDIGFAIHTEREKHANDNPLRAYTIPLIINIGANGHARIDSQGMHWTRLLITVDPLTNPPAISANYTDTLLLSSAVKNTIQAELSKSLKYHEEVGTRSNPGGVQIFKAFPDCENPVIRVTGTGEQTDGYTCGYRALKGIIGDLIEVRTITGNPQTNAFLACDTATKLRDFVYRKLIGEQVIPSNMYEKIRMNGQVDVAIFKKKDGNNGYQIDTSLIDGELHGFGMPELRRPKQKIINIEKLKQLALDKKMLEKLSNVPLMAAIRDVNAQKEPYTIDVKTVLVEIEAAIRDGSFQGKMPDLAQQLKAIFKAVLENPNITQIHISDVEGLDADTIKALEVALENLPLDKTLTASSPELASFIEMLEVRNALIIYYFSPDAQLKNPWDELFQAMISDSYQSKIQAVPELALSAKLKMTGITKFFQYITNHEEVFPDDSFPFKQFKINFEDVEDATEDGLTFLQTLITHLQSNAPGLTYFPFNKIVCKMRAVKPIKGTDLVRILQVLLPILSAQNIERLDLQVATFDGLELTDIQALQTLVETQNITTIFSIQDLPGCLPAQAPIQDALIHLGSSIATNRRKTHSLENVVNKSENVASISALGQDSLGKIGRAIFDLEGELHLDQEVQLQEQVQVQSQVQQQIQSIDLTDMPEEDELLEEAFLTFAGDEQLLDRNGFINDPQINNIIKMEMIGLTAAECWDMMFGRDSNQFAFGIQKITLMAAKKCLAHFQDFQFQIHPDNPPHGFNLAKDPSGKLGLVLVYDPINPPLNRNKSPLTPSLSRARQPNNWVGDARQFLTPEQAEKLHVKIKGKLSKAEKKPYSLEGNIAHFYYIKSGKYSGSSNEIKLIVLHAFIEGISPKLSLEVNAYIKKIFGDSPSNKNISALSEILYENGVESMLDLLSNLDELKRIRGDEFFQSFKEVFIDQSLNLNELLTDDSLAALDTLKEFSNATATWWQSLTEQHSQNIAFKGNGDNFEMIPPKRHSNLAELCQGFTYFNNELEKIKPGLVLSDTCPLSGMADMRVGLDRLLTILKNAATGDELTKARNVDEQFENLNDLLLDGLGAFYASRYEGYKLVTAAMNLLFGSLGKTPKDELKLAEQGMVFRVAKAQVRNAIYPHLGSKPLNSKNNKISPYFLLRNLVNSSEFNPQINELLKAYFLRFIATFNHRADLSIYEDIFYYIASEDFLNKFPVDTYVGYRENILVMIAFFGTGKRGQSFSKKDVDTIKQFLEKLTTHNQKIDGAVLFRSWSDISKLPVKPTVSELIAISEVLLEASPYSSDKISEKTSSIKSLGASYKSNANFLFEALADVAKNKSHLPIDALIRALVIIEDPQDKQSDRSLLMQLRDYIARIKFANHSLDGFSDMVSKLLAENLNNKNRDRYFHETIEKTLKSLDKADDDDKLEAIYQEQDASFKEYNQKGRASSPKYNDKEDMGLFLRANLVKVLAKCKYNVLADETYNEEDLIDKINQLYSNVNSCHIKHGQEQSYALVELLSNIDIEKSEGNLPTLDNLIALTQEIADTDEVLSFNALLEKVKTHLPEGAILSFQHAVVDSGASAVNLHSILAKNMVEIRLQLNKYSHLYPGLKDFIDSLSTARGPEILLDKLQWLANMDAMAFGIEQTIKNKVMDIMLNVYQSVIDKGIGRTNIRQNKNQQHILKILIEEQLTHPIKNQKDFKDFANNFASELKKLEEFLLNVQKINETWPNEFPLLLNNLHEAKNIADYSLSELIKITAVFIDNYNKLEPFPVGTFKLFFPRDKSNSPKDVLAVLDFIYDENRQEKYNLNDKEREKLCELMFYFYDQNDRDLCLIRMIKLKDIQPELFGVKLDLLVKEKDVKLLNVLQRLENSITYLNQVLDKSPDLTREVLSFYRNHADDFNDFMEALGKIDDLDERINLLQIVIKAAIKTEQTSEPPYNKANIAAVVGALKANPAVLTQLAVIYSGSIYPDIIRLKTELDSVTPDKSLDFEKLESEFDRDPFGFRANEATGEDTIQAQFDTVLFTSVKIIANNAPTKAEKDAVVEMKNIFFIVQGKKVQIGYCSKDGTYVQVKVDSKAVIKLLSKYTTKPIVIKDKTDLEIIKSYLQTKNARIQSSLTDIIDGMRSLNYDRPLLTTEREELQRGFLYLNAIGVGFDEENPCTLSTVYGVEKAVKEMSSAEIRDLQSLYRETIKNGNPSKPEKIKIQLDYVALIREVMYRTTGQFPRATQILFLIKAIQAGDNLVAQIKTGEGKSKTAALAAALLSLEGLDADIVTTNLELATDGLKKNQAFFDYLGIAASSDYDAPGIHYGSLSTLDTHYSKMELAGKDFPENRVGIIDELDASTQDDSTQNRIAVSKDLITNPYESPFEWAMKALIQFVDEQQTFKTDEALLESAKIRLRKEANSLIKKTLLENLENKPEEYALRVTTWLMAASRTRTLVKQEESRFRIETLPHPDGKSGNISKACILINGRPNFVAEFSHTIQQMLHLRLRENSVYKANIADKVMPPFLVEPEKVYISSSNSNLFIQRYKRCLAMTATPGSKKEIEEQQQKYHLNFVSIPPYAPSLRLELEPLLTSAKYVNKPEKEDQEHIQNIVSDILRILALEKKGELARPILVHAKTKIEGEKIREALDLALQQALEKNPSKYRGKYTQIQPFYSDKDTQVESACITKAGECGVITISTVFGRGTDIIPKNHNKGVYNILTTVDTLGVSDEDIERSMEQRKGRTARQGQYGETRLIIKRSEFRDVYTKKELKQIPAKKDAVNQAIQALNQFRNRERTVARNDRESFEKLKDVCSKQFSLYSKAIQLCENATFKKHIKESIKNKRALFLESVDEKWLEIQSNPENKDKQAVELLDVICQFTTNKWNTAVDLELAKEARQLATQLNITDIADILPANTELNAHSILETIQRRGAATRRYYIKKEEVLTALNPTLRATEAYCDMRAGVGDTSSNTNANLNIDNLRNNLALKKLKETIGKLDTPAFRSKLNKKYALTGADSQVPNLLENTASALLYLRYKAYRDDNPLAFASLNREYQKLLTTFSKTKNKVYLNQIAKAEEKHFFALHAHKGKQEKRKMLYLNQFMSESRYLLPLEDASWKDAGFKDWWQGEGKAEGVSFRSKVVNILTSYQNNWWSRTWVSNDRKLQANQLITKLQHDKNISMQTIMVEIHSTRKSLLNDDITKGRTIQAGLKGRFNAYLDDIKMQAILASSPHTLDALVGYQFEDIKNVLEIFKLKLKIEDPLGKAIQTTIDVLDISKINVNNALQIEEITKQYAALSAFFNEIEALSNSNGSNHNSNPTKNGNFQALSEFCKNKQVELETYFSQCGRLNEVTNEAYATDKALSRGAISCVKEALTRPLDGKARINAISAINPKLKKMDYNDDSIALIIPDGIDKALTTNSFFNKINHLTTYQVLLSNTEKAIVEKSQSNPNVLFKSIALTTYSIEAEVNFKLTIAYEVDGVENNKTFNFNMTTQTVHLDEGCISAEQQINAGPKN